MNVFEALEKYSPRPDVDPKENFFTNAFAYILNDSRSAASAFIRLLFRQKANVLVRERFVFVSQMQIKDGVIDLLAESKSVKIYIECKLSSPEGKGDVKEPSQIERYLRVARSERGKNYVAYSNAFRRDLESLYSTANHNKPTGYQRTLRRITGGQ